MNPPKQPMVIVLCEQSIIYTFLSPKLITKQFALIYVFTKNDYAVDLIIIYYNKIITYQF